MQPENTLQYFGRSPSCVQDIDTKFWQFVFHNFLRKNMDRHFEFCKIYFSPGPPLILVLFHLDMLEQNNTAENPK